MGVWWLRCSAGFTMVETVLSASVIAMACLGNLMIIQNTYQANITTSHQMIATQLANEKIETVIADRSLQPLSYDFVTGSNYPADTINYGAQTGVFSRTTTVVEVAEDLSTPTPNSGIKKVDVAVSWGNLPHEKVTVSTLVAKY